jgi:hypothetical protein
MTGSAEADECRRLEKMLDEKEASTSAVIEALGEEAVRCRHSAHWAFGRKEQEMRISIPHSRCAFPSLDLPPLCFFHRSCMADYVIQIFSKCTEIIQSTPPDPSKHMRSCDVLKDARTSQ